MNDKYITTSRRNRTLESLDLKNGSTHFYMIEQGFGLVHKLRKNKSIFGIDEYVYTGRLHKGDLTFATGEELKIIVPRHGKYNYGFTLEGEANEMFKVRNALTSYNKFENRTFSYVNPNSVLEFVGDPFVNYSLYVRIYEDCYGVKNSRWVVIYAQKPNDDELKLMKDGQY